MWGTGQSGSGQALVVEDNPETRGWLISCVTTAFPGLQILSAASLADAMALLEGQEFDLALVDLGLPDGSGMELIRALHGNQPDCYVVVATIYDDDRNLFAALKSGAKGYILKDQDRERIASYLQGIRKNQPPLSPASSKRLIDHFNSKADALAEAHLTPREIDVLCLIGKGYSVEDAATMLQLSSDTIKGYVKTIYTKLGVSNRSEVTLEAIRLGLIDPL
jgi:DNA-binding NarL/FixJ family response regulator